MLQGIQRDLFHSRFCRRSLHIRDKERVNTPEITRLKIVGSIFRVALFDEVGPLVLGTVTGEAGGITCFSLRMRLNALVIRQLGQQHGHTTGVGDARER